MKLSADEMNSIQGLVHYLNESFDGHGIIASVNMFGVTPGPGGREPSKGEIGIDTDGVHYTWRTEYEQ